MANKARNVIDSFGSVALVNRLFVHAGIINFILCPKVKGKSYTQISFISFQTFKENPKIIVFVREM